MGEPLNEEAYGSGLVVRGRHIALENDDADLINAQRRILSNEIFAAPIILFPTVKDQSGPNVIKLCP